MNELFRDVLLVLFHVDSLPVRAPFIFTTTAWIRPLARWGEKMKKTSFKTV